MRPKENISQNRTAPVLHAGRYEKPAIEIIEVELEQSILAGSGDALPQIPGKYW